MPQSPEVSRCGVSVLRRHRVDAEADAKVKRRFCLAPENFVAQMRPLIGLEFTFTF
jgi:hypothetical protein